MSGGTAPGIRMGAAGKRSPSPPASSGAAEVWDALSTSRPYQEKLKVDQAVRRMQELSGAVLDPAVVAALSEVVERRRSLTFLIDGEGAPHEMREWGVESPS